MDTTIHIQKDGRFVLPDQIRQKYGIRDGDSLRMIALGGNFVVTPVDSVTHLASRIEQARLEAGVSTEEVLAALRNQRSGS